MAGALFEGKAEGAITAVTALVGQLLGNDGLIGPGKFVIAADEVVDA